MNAADRLGQTALHVAADRGHVAVVHELLVAGGDLTVQNDKGETPIAIAVKRGQTELVECEFECLLPRSFNVWRPDIRWRLCHRFFAFHRFDKARG